MIPNFSYAADGWKPDPDVIARFASRHPETNFDEAKVPAYTLPDVLHGVTSREQWPRRREEILEMFRTQMFGRSPGKPQELKFEVLEENPAAMNGAATLKRIAIRSRQGERSNEFHLVLFLPNAHKPAPVFLFINNRSLDDIDSARAKKSDYWPAEEMIARGYGIAAIQNSELAPDDAKKFRDGVIGMFEDEATTRPTDAWGAIGAWAWGASRAMDYLETDSRVDAKRVAVVGSSRGGKTALWTGAQDERFSLVISNASGCGGAALSRRRFGETVALINNHFPHWFCDNFKRFNEHEDQLPFDQHMLIALIAPRAVYVASGSEDLWADPCGEFLSLVEASPVYALWGNSPIKPTDMPPVDTSFVAGPRGYHIHTGPHGLTLPDWQHFADFADKHWR